METDADLLRRAQAGEMAGVRAIYERYLPVVWRFAYSQVHGNVHEAEEVTAETFLAAVRTLGRLDADGVLLSGWLIGIARHKLADQRRKTAQTMRLLRVVESAAVSETPIDGEAEAVAAETRDQIGRILESLADDERLVLEWKYLDDLAVREIAGRLGRTEKAVEALLFRARQAFRQHWNRINHAQEEAPR